MSSNSLATAMYTLASPYYIPSSIIWQKSPNLGDLFIEWAVKDLLGYSPKVAISLRDNLSDCLVSIINNSKLLVIAGANHLDHSFSIFGNSSIEELMRIKVPIHIYGLGASETTRSLSKEAAQKIKYIVDNHGLIGARCKRTFDLVRSALSQSHGSKGSETNFDRVLFTGCPVAVPRLKRNQNNVLGTKPYGIITNTLRGDYLKRELALLNEYRQSYPSLLTYCIFHQPFSNAISSSFSKPLNFISSQFYSARKRSDMNIYLKALESHNISIFPTLNGTDFINCYLEASVHFGSRLHAHLLRSSFGLESYLLPIDSRSMDMDSHFLFKRILTLNKNLGYLFSLPNPGDSSLYNITLSSMKNMVEITQSVICSTRSF